MMASFTDIIHLSMTRRCVTWRRYGKHSELRRPMIHRFEVKGGDTLATLMAQSIVMSNPLLDALKRSRRA